MDTLAAAAGANLSTTTRADVWVGSPPPSQRGRRRGEGATVVGAEWLYDCVSMCEAQEVERYAAAVA